MLEMRPDCERCGRDLPADIHGAFICSFECTFCTDCAGSILGGRCPNCGGGFSARPVRPKHLLAKYPPSSLRIRKPDGCATAA